MKQMGEDLDRRMVFVISTQSMNWFDSALQGDIFALADTIKMLKESHAIELLKKTLHGSSLLHVQVANNKYETWPFTSITGLL